MSILRGKKKDMAIKYRAFIEDNFSISDKSGKIVPFQFNPIQTKFFENDYADESIVLKARQQGFSSLITAIFATDFILRANSYSAVVADVEENATGLLDKIKFYLDSYAAKTGVKVPLKYDSRFELYNPLKKSRIIIGTARSTEFGRSRTITNLLLSEIAFYPNIEKILAGAGQAVVEGGRKILETTANGFNDFKKIWEAAVLGESIYKPLFYNAEDFYPAEFLSKKKKELGDRFMQEYPSNPVEAFISSGQLYFNREALKTILTFANNFKQRGINVIPAIS